MVQFIYRNNFYKKNDTTIKLYHLPNPLDNVPDPFYSIPDKNTLTEDELDDMIENAEKEKEEMEELTREELEEMGLEEIQMKALENKKKIYKDLENRVRDFYALHRLSKKY